jgi:hypothetical protein
MAEGRCCGILHIRLTDNSRLVVQWRRRLQSLVKGSLEFLFAASELADDPSAPLGNRVPAICIPILV